MLIGTEDWMTAPGSLRQLQKLLQPVPSWTPERIEYFWHSIESMRAPAQTDADESPADAGTSAQPTLLICAARSEPEFLIFRPAVYQAGGELDDIAQKLVLSPPQRIGITDYEDLTILPNHEARRGTGTEYIESGEHYIPAPLGRWVVEDKENARILGATVLGSSIRYLMLSIPRIESLIHDLIAYSGQPARRDPQ